MSTVQYIKINECAAWALAVALFGDHAHSADMVMRDHWDDEREEIEGGWRGFAARHAPAGEPVVFFHPHDQRIAYLCLELEVGEVARMHEAGMVRREGGHYVADLATYPPTAHLN